MSKEEWIAFYQKKADACPDIDMDVIRFIADILYHSPDSNDTVYTLFAAGYCYYFACMLRIAFRRGRICQAFPYGHMVWEDGTDGNGIAYDIGGICDQYEWLVPIDSYGDIMKNWRHVPSEQDSIPSAEYERDYVTNLVKKIYGTNY